MATQDFQLVSPAESLLSAPGDNYTSLFDGSNLDDKHTTLNPMEMMSPQSYIDKSDALSPVAEEDEQETTDDKRPTKKRKSWGQVLPEPKTNLPPRKRAKTDDEKEQRRVERVLRNRRAAQSSRERKRLEVEALEKRNQELEALLLNAQKANLVLAEQLDQIRRDSGVVTRTSTSLDSLRDNQISLSPTLFNSQDGHNADAKSADDLMKEILMDANPTVDPVALSPELGPKKEPDTEPELMAQTESTSPDMTQHPAAMLSDLQCHMSAEDAAPFGIGSGFSMPAAADTDRYVLESELLASPESTAFDDDYLVGDSAPGFADGLFDINDFLSDEAGHVVSDIMAASNYAAADQGLDAQVHDPETQISS
ncbi:Basic leucine zipper [Cordyceps fumosorosea ARSEF 2679]|uniref:Basic leucine zipper n=1 Tax=Cordyceps fumosorosea (strain ARSEF 2679) TaxID=1081104 RepID=A0A167HIZ6_CORFA|nr:Basic leucine zipper [Cordyceps fumosorosea ARSEF 2679]OAA47966.1 Basic leucine zipper [Cordyceps fumosorosea ARSEF 2679]